MKHENTMMQYTLQKEVVQRQIFNTKSGREQVQQYLTSITKWGRNQITGSRTFWLPLEKCGE